MPEKNLNGTLVIAHNHSMLVETRPEPLKVAAAAEIVANRCISNPAANQFDQTTANQSTSQRNKLVQRAVHWCLVTGFVVVPKQIRNEDALCVTYLPFTLMPTPFKRADFKQVFDLQPHINLLVSQLASSFSVIEKALDK